MMSLDLALTILASAGSPRSETLEDENRAMWTGSVRFWKTPWRESFNLPTPFTQIERYGWGSLAGQFLVQVVVCLIVFCLHVPGLIFSSVSKRIVILGGGVALIQLIAFGALLLGGNWAASHVIDYESWNTKSALSMAAFLGTVILCLFQVPGKIVLANMCVWSPHFFEASMTVPRNERVTFARRVRTENAAAVK